MKICKHLSIFFSLYSSYKGCIFNNQKPNPYKMNKFIKKATEISGVLIQVGIVFIIIGSVLRLLNRPGSEIYVTISKIFAGIFSLIAFFEIVYSKRISLYSKCIWIFCLISFNIFTVLVYFFKRQNLGYNSSTTSLSQQVI